MTRILIVEDEPVVRGPITGLLELHGYQVVAAATEDEALRLALEGPPDLVILDVHLAKGSSGIEVCERLRATPRLERVPIMMLTGDQSRETIVRCIAAGANDYYLKSGFHVESLLARVEKWTGRKDPRKRSADEQA